MKIVLGCCLVAVLICAVASEDNDASDNGENIAKSTSYFLPGKDIETHNGA